MMWQDAPDKAVVTFKFGRAVLGNRLFIAATKPDGRFVAFRWGGNKFWPELILALHSRASLPREQEACMTQSKYCPKDCPRLWVFQSVCGEGEYYPHNPHDLKKDFYGRYLRRSDCPLLKQEERK